MKLNSTKKRILVLCFDVSLIALYFLLMQISVWMLDSTTECTYMSQGIICPACGGTRAVNSFLSGDFESAFFYNPFVFCVIIYLILVILFLNLECIFNLEFAHKIRRAMTDYRVIIAAAILYALYAIIRICF